MRSLASQPSVGAATVPLRLPGSTATAPTDPHGPPYDAAHPAAIRVATTADHAAFSTTAACAAAALATAVLAADAVVTISISISVTASIAAATAPIAAATAPIAAAASPPPPPVPYSPFVTVVGTRFYRAGVSYRYPPLAAINLWAWGGEGRPRQPRAAAELLLGVHCWQQGDALIGDPPH